MSLGSKKKDAEASSLLYFFRGLVHRFAQTGCFRERASCPRRFLPSWSRRPSNNQSGRNDEQGPFRHALSIGLTVFFAVIAGHFFSGRKEGWIVLSAFLICQITRVTSLRQGIHFLFLLALAVFIETIMIADASAKMTDVLIGGVIGILFGYFVLPVKLYAEFRQDLLPVLNALFDYAQALTTYLHEKPLKEIQEIHFLDKLKFAIEEKLRAPDKVYPEWVYELGFNPELRSGFRFFLIHLEQMVEIFFSLNYFVSYHVNPILWQKLNPFILLALEKNNELLHVLLAYFQDNTLQNRGDDFMTDLTELESVLRESVPASIELLDISPDYVALTGMVSSIKEIRKLLLELLSSLPEGNE